MIVGPVGGNGTQLATAVADAPEGPVWSRHISRFGERDMPLFALRQILRSLRIPDDATLDEVEAAARSVISKQGDTSSTIVLGSADVCDPESLDVLLRLARSEDIRLIVTLTPETASAQEELLAGAQRIDIPPLSFGTIAALLQARFGYEPHPTVVEILNERSQGTYDVIQELADAAFDSGALIVVEDVLVPVPSRTQNALTRLDRRRSPRSAELDGGDELTDLLHLVAVLGEIDLGEARDCVSSATVDVATQHGALTVVDGGLAFTSKAESLHLMRTLAQERLVELFEAYADRLTLSVARPGNAVHAADWWRSAGRLLPVQLATRAAREANLMGRHRRAVVFSDPTANDEHAVIALLERGFALHELGDADGLRAMYTAIDGRTLTEEELLPYLRWTLRLGPEDDPQGLRDHAIEADDADTARRRLAVRALIELAVTVFDVGGDQLVTRLRSLAFSDQLSAPNRAFTFTILSTAQRFAGHPRQAVESAEHALDILRDEGDRVSAFHLDLAQETKILGLITSLDFDRAELALRDYSAGFLGRPGSGRMTLALRGVLAMQRSDVSQALANSRLCLAGVEHHDPHHMRGWVAAMLAQILAQSQRPDEAREFLSLAEQHPAEGLQHNLERRIFQACTHDILAEPEEALSILTAVTAEARASGLRLAEIDAAVLSVQIGGPVHLPTLLDAVQELVEPSGTTAVWQTFAFAAQRYDIPALTSLSEQLEELSAHLIAAAVAQYVLDMARRASDLTEDTRSRLTRLADPMSHRRQSPIS